MPNPLSGTGKLQVTLVAQFFLNGRLIKTSRSIVLRRNWKVSNTAYMPGLLIAGLVVGLVVGVFVPQVHQAYVTETRTELVKVTETVPQTVRTTEHATTTETRTKLESQTSYKVLTTTETIQTVAPEYRLGYQEWGPLRILSTNFLWCTEELAVIFAELQNTGSQNLQSVTVGIMFFDENNRVIYADSCYSVINILLPNQRTPVVWAVASFPHVRTYHVFIQSWSETSIQPYREFRVEEIKTWIDSDGYFHLSGEVVNTGGLTAGSTGVVVTLYDREGKIVFGGGAALPVTPAELNPGSRGSFDFFVTFEIEKIDHWSTQVQCSE